GGAGGRRGAGHQPLRARRDVLLRAYPVARGAGMKLIESRLTMVATYIVLGIGAFIALFPIALLVVNSLKPAAAIVVSPLSLPGIIRWENFAHAWRDGHFSKTFVNSVTLSALSIILVCGTAAPTAYVLARRKIRSWK